MSKTWTVYLSGEIHSDWREQIASGIAEKSLPVTLTAPVTDHDASDQCGVRILGDEDKPFWVDHKGALVNSIRTQTLIKDADLVVVRFGEKYKQWNAAFDAGYAAALTHPSETGVYTREEDVVRTLFTALSTGLQFTSETRLGRPLGTFDRPRPRRAEAWRSDRALRNVVLSLGALETLATTLAKDAPEIAAALAADFARAQDRLSDLDDPNFAQVSDPAQRLKVEIAQQAIDQIRTRVTTELGPALGVAAGFNALDGD